MLDNASALRLNLVGLAHLTFVLGGDYRGTGLRSAGIARHVPEIACPSTPPALVAARVQTLDFRSGEDLLAAKIKGLDACASHDWSL